MSNFKIHSVESAPEQSKPILEGAVKQMGRVPGLFGVMAESPNTLKAYTQLHQAFNESSFDADELTVVWQTINVEHECHYCVPAHTGIAHSMNVDPAIDRALRNQTEMPTKKLQVLHKTTLLVLRNRGLLSDEALEAFYAAGYEQKHILGILLGLSQKVISNYINHIAKTPIDDAFKKFA